MISNNLSKKTLAAALGVPVDSLRKALERMGLKEVNSQNVFAILEWYSKPVPGRNIKIVEAAKKLLVSNHTNVYIDNRQVGGIPPFIPLNALSEPPPPPPILPEPPQSQPIPESAPIPEPKRDVVGIASSDAVVLVLAFAGAFAIAVGITSPMFMAVGIAPALAYILAVFIDISAFIFMCRGRFHYGVIMAICTALQAAFTVGAFNWVDAEILTICKGFTVAFAIGLVIHGYSSIIATKVKEND